MPEWGIFQGQDGFLLSNNISLIAELILPHKISLLKLHLPQDGHIWVYPYPQQKGISILSNLLHCRKIHINFFPIHQWDFFLLIPSALGVAGYVMFKAVFFNLQGMVEGSI